MEPQLVDELTRFIEKNAPFQYLETIQGRPVAYWKEAGVYNYIAFYNRSLTCVMRFRWTTGLHGQVQGVTLMANHNSDVPDDDDLGEITLWLTLANIS